MGKGSKKLFNDLFSEEKKPFKRGRSAEFGNERNACLIDRYLFFVILSGLRYEIILETVSKEFFLSPVTIKNILDANYSTLAALKRQYQDYKERQHVTQLKGEFTKKWPHFIWEIKQVNTPQKRA